MAKQTYREGNAITYENGRRILIISRKGRTILFQESGGGPYFVGTVRNDRLSYEEKVGNSIRKALSKFKTRVDASS